MPMGVFALGIPYTNRVVRREFLMIRKSSNMPQVWGRSNNFVFFSTSVIRHAGCLCPQGWIGDFCEVWQEKKFEYPEDYPHSRDEDSNRRVIIMAFIVLAASTLLVAFTMFYRSRWLSGRPLPGFRGFGMRRQYSKKTGFRSSIIANAQKSASNAFDDTVGNIRRSWKRRVSKAVVDQSENLAPYDMTAISDDDEDGEKGLYTIHVDPLHRSGSDDSSQGSFMEVLEDTEEGDETGLDAA